MCSGRILTEILIGMFVLSVQDPIRGKDEIMTRRDEDGWTPHEHKVYEAIRSFTEMNGYSPTFRDIGQIIGNKNPSHIRYGVKSLVKKGIIQRNNGCSRTIQLVINEIERIAEVLRLPLAGRIQAGQPIHLGDTDLQRFDSETYIEVPRSLLPRNTEGLFALQVKGDSMMDAMIADGDIVIFRAIQQAYNGQMVAVWLVEEGETTLKRYYLDNEQVRLQPANPAYQPLFYPSENVQVQGEVVFTYREY
jgi:repressor LexA